MRLADVDRVPQGVNAATMGAVLYEKLGYKKICDVVDSGDENDTHGYPQCCSHIHRDRCRISSFRKPTA